MIKKKINFFCAVQHVIFKYILNNKEIRIMIIVVMICIVISRWLLHKSAEINKEIAELLKQKNYQLNKQIIKLWVFGTLSAIFRPISSLYICRASNLSQLIARNEGYEHFLKMDFEQWDKLSRAEILNIILRRSDAIKQIVGAITTYMIPQLVSVFVTCIYTFKTLGGGQTILLLGTLIMYTYITIKIQEWRNHIRWKNSFYLDKSDNVAYEGLENITSIIGCGCIDYEIIKYKKTLEKICHRETYFERSLHILEIIQAIIWNSGKVLIIWYMVIILRSLSVGNFAYFATTLGGFSGALSNLSRIYRLFAIGITIYNQRSLPQKQNIFQETIEESFNFFNTIFIDNSALTCCGQNIISQQGIQIFNGDKIALIGSNGCGKSSILKVIAGRCCRSKRILVDGYNIKMKMFIEGVSYITCHGVLFNESVMYNLQYGNNEITEDMVIIGAKFLGVHSIFMRLNEGYQTNCGEQGKNLSAGERQIVFVLREYLRDCPLLIIDEGTTNIEKKIEMTILEKLLEMPNKTIIMASHDKNITQKFNRKLEIRNYEIFEIYD